MAQIRQSILRGNSKLERIRIEGYEEQEVIYLEFIITSKDISALGVIPSIGVVLGLRDRDGIVTGNFLDHEHLEVVQTSRCFFDKFISGRCCCFPCFEEM